MWPAPDLCTNLNVSNILIQSKCPEQDLNLHGLTATSS